MKLFEYTGFAMLTYTIKQQGKEFIPVGEKMLSGILNNEESKESMLFICDEEGYAKAQSKPLPSKKAQETLKKMIENGLEEYKGNIKTVS